jgi:hypothetical protein
VEWRPADGFRGKIWYRYHPRYCREIFIIKPFFYIKISHTYAIDEGLVGEKSSLEAVLPISFENFLPYQQNPSAAGEKIRPHIKFTHKGQYVLQPKFRPLGNTA